MPAMETGSPTRRDGGTLNSTAVDTSTPMPAGGAALEGARSPLRRAATHRRALALGAAAITAISLAACGGSKESNAPTGKLLNMHTVIASIEESFAAKRHIHATIKCPTSEEQRAGNNFTCVATGFAGTGKDRKPFNVHVAVTQVNDKGYVKYVSY